MQCCYCVGIAWAKLNVPRRLTRVAKECLGTDLKFVTIGHQKH